MKITEQGKGMEKEEGIDRKKPVYIHNIERKVGKYL